VLELLVPCRLLLRLHRTTTSTVSLLVAAEVTLIFILH